MFIYNSCRDVDQKVTHYLGEKNSKKTKAIALEIALGALTIAANKESYSPIKYYRTSFFVESVATPLKPIVKLPSDESAALFHDKLLYHALLYSLSKTLFSLTPLNDERVLSLMATPTFINFVASQDWFQKLKKECLQLGLKVSISEAINYTKHQIKYYLNTNFLNPIRKLIAEDKSVLFQNLQDSCKEFIAERFEIVKDLTLDAQQAYKSVVDGGEHLLQPHQLDAALNRMKSATEKIHHLASMPKISIVKHQALKDRSPIPFYLKAYTAWTLVADFQPALAPMLFSSPCTDAVDIAVRIAGMSTAYATGHNFLSTVATEVVSQSIPNVFRRFPANLRLSELTHRESSRAIGRLEQIKRTFYESVEAEGVSHSTLKTIDKVAAQCFTGSIFVITSLNSHPLVNALGASNFIEYLGIVEDHYHLAELNNIGSQTPYLDKIPYQIIAGLALTATEMGVGLPRPLTTLICTTLSLPIVIDRVLVTDFYQNHILTPLKEVINPNYRLQKWANVSGKAASLAESVGLGSALTKYTRAAANATQLAVVVQTGSRFLKDPMVQKAGAGAVIITAAATDIYMKSIFCTTVSFYFGTGIGGLANGISKPKDLTTLSAVSAGVVVGILSQSPFQATATTEIVEFALRTPQGRNCCLRINNLFYAAVPLFKKALNTGVTFSQSCFNYLKRKFV